MSDFPDGYCPLGCFRGWLDFDGLGTTCPHHPPKEPEHLFFRPQGKRSEERIAELRAMDYHDYLKTPEWANMRLFAQIEKGFCCDVCGSSGRVLDVHHLRYDNLGDEKLEDLQVLCRQCHAEQHDKPYVPPRKTYLQMREDAIKVAETRKRTVSEDYW